MDVTPLVKQGQQIIQSYAGGVFTISGQRYDGPVIVTPEGSFDWKSNRSVSKIEGPDKPEFRIEDFDDILQQSQAFDVFLLGTGSAIHFLPPLLRNSLKEQGVSFDVMDTGAACRTYNVLMAEGRRVLAALLPSS